jgi:hypothetical protein
MICSGVLGSSGSLDVSCVLDVTGQFAIIVNDNGDNETGDYDLSLTLN